ncbi:MAG: NIL domain-containing protein, partial [Lachnospiraceae bacterium]|nr:NIL domain-containing protein [Lachnospiraceae bacterium]
DEIFEHPTSDAAKELISGKDIAFTPLKSFDTNKKIRIVFKENSAYEPVISNMILKYKTPINILKADTRNINGTARGEMILSLPEEDSLAEDIIGYLRDNGLVVTDTFEEV